MTRRWIAAAALATCVAVSACREADAAKNARADSTAVAQRETRLERTLSERDSAVRDSTVDRKAIARWILPKNLDELSGIVLTHDGRLLAHGDEKAQVSEIDYRRGVVTKQFVVGHPTVKADLEAITIAKGLVYLLASNGTLYEFREGTNGARVDYTTHDTRLGKECEFEGLAFDSTLNALVLACKHVGTKHLKDDMVIYRWTLEESGNRLSRLTVPLKDIVGPIGVERFHPSDITIDPFTGDYVLISGIEKAIVEITPDGHVVFARRLPPGHDQPESVAITKDSILIIGDEAKQRPAILTLYRWP